MFKKSLLFMLLMALFMPWAAQAQSELTVYGDGANANGNVPFYGLYADTQGAASECVIPSDQLTAMAGGTITGLKFYITTSAAAAWTGTHQVYLGEVAETTLTGITGPDAFEVVATASFDATGSELTIDFDDTYNYGGGNLLIGTYVSVAGNWKSAQFAGANQETNTGWYRSSGSAAGSAVQFLPKTTFYYTTGGVVCDKPDTFTLVEGSITATSALFNWTGGSGSYNFQYKKSTDEEYLNYPTESTAFSLEDLTPGTTYNVRVQSVCDDGVSGWKSLTFTTKFGIPLVEEFGTGNLPTSWSKYTGLLSDVMEGGALTSGSSWSFGTANGVFDSHARVNLYGTGCKYWLVVPEIVMEDNVELRFDLALTAYSGSLAEPSTTGTDDKFVVLISTDNMETWSILRQWDNAGSEFVLNDIPCTANGQNIKINLSDYAGDNVIVAFYGESTESNADNNLHIDNVSINYIPSCEMPENLAATYADGVATITWEGADYCNIDVNGEIYNNKASGFQLTELEAGTVYEVKIQAICGSETSDWTRSVSFSTPCDAYELPIEEGFEDETEFICWTVINTAAANTAEITTTQAYTGDHSFQFTSYSSASSYDQYLITPEIDTEDGIKASFVYARQNAGDQLQVGYSTTTNDIDAFEWGEWLTPDVQTWVDFNGVYPAGTKYIALHYYGNYAYYLWVDDINIVVDDGCRIPTDFTASNETGFTVDLSWTENGEATAWYIAYMAADDEEVSYAYAETNPFTLDGLTPTTTYYAMVSPECGDNDSWSDAITFRTTEACPKPSISVEAHPTSAIVSWTGPADAYGFEWAAVPEDDSKDGGLWLQYDNDTYSGGIGNSSANTWTWGVMYPASMLEGNGLLSKVSIYEQADYNTEDITIEIYSGGDTEPETLIYSETITPEAGDAFHEITLSEFVTIDPTQNLWITLTEYGTYVLGYCDGNESNNDWVYSGGWAHIGDLAPSLDGSNWMIRGYVEPSFDPSTLDWQPITGATSPQTLNNLLPEHQYAVRIKSLCGDEYGESDWAMVTFWTPSNCAIPENLVAVPAAKTAELSWSNNQNSYNLRYRHTVEVDPSTPATIILEAHDTWGDGTGYQMLLDADATAFGVEIPESGPYTGTDYSAFEYLIPENADCDSNTENIVFDGSVTLEIPAGVYDWCIINPEPGGNMWISGNGDVPGRYDDYVFEAGVTYHFTMLRFGTGDGAALEIDRPMSDWTDVENITTVPYTLTGLTPVTYYEWQVQGVNCDGLGANTEWSEVANFFTEPVTTITQTVELDAGTTYVSFYVDITLDDLKAALVEACGTSATITIKSKTQNVKYQRGRWSGQLAALDLAQMYLINTTVAAEMVLEDDPIDPSTLSVEIVNGNNYIAYPFEENQTVANFFAGFAYDQDQVKGKSASTKYSRGRWAGALGTLEPGQGYIYVSAYPETRTFTFPALSKAGRDVQTTAPVAVGETKKVEINYLDLEIIRPITFNKTSNISLFENRPIRPINVNKASK